MEWLFNIATILFLLIGLDSLRKYLKSHMIVVIDKEDILREEDMEAEDIINLKPNYEQAIDLRGTPAHVCVCGCNVFNLKVIFQDFQIVQYFLDMECAQCGSLLTAPTPVDKD